MLEKSITNQVIKQLNKYSNVWVRKRHTTGMSGTIGWPDITGTVTIYRNDFEFGIRIEIEMKKPGKKPTQNQYSRLRRFRKMGAIAFWADNYEQAVTQFAYWCDVVGREPISYTDLMKSGNVTVISDL